MFIIRNKHIFFTLTALVVAAAIGCIAVFGLHLSIDFTGGTLAQISYDGTRPAPDILTKNLTEAGFTDFSLREYGDNGYALRAQTLTPEQQSNLAAYFTNQSASAHVDSLNEIGPTIGTELRNKSIEAVALVLLCILLFIAFAFRKVSKPVSSWMYGLMAIVGLTHNVIVTTGFYSLLGHINGAQVDSLFVTAVLTVLGFSVHDTIVVFDRVRENLRINQQKGIKEQFDETAGRSLNQTFVRSVNTSLTVALTLLVLYAIGPVSTKDFALTLLVGIIAGTYSSIFLATPLLVWVEGRRRHGGR